MTTVLATEASPEANLDTTPLTQGHSVSALEDPGVALALLSVTLTLKSRQRLSQGRLSLTLVSSSARPRTTQGVNAEVGSGVLNRDAGLSLSPSPQAPASPPRPPSRPRSIPTAVAARPRPATLAHLSAGLILARQPRPPAGFQGPGLWAESAQGGIYLKSHRKVKLGSKKSFCRWFIKNAKEADHSHSLNVSNSCK